MGLKGEHFSLYASDGNDELISFEPNRKLIPASVTKIITAAAALRELEPSYKVTTELLANSPIEKGILKGPLFLRGGGDPGFVSESMWVLVNELTRSQITRLEGDIVVDDSKFDHIRFDPTRDPVRNDRAYDAPVGAMSMNWNSVNVFVRPAGRAGEKAQVVADPDTDYIKINNQTQTVSGHTVDLHVSRKGQPLADDDAIGVGDQLTISGRIGIHAPEKVIYRSISHPDIWAGYNLVAFMKQRGIEFKGKIISGLTPPSARMIAHVESKPVGAMVADMLKFSNNFVAEMLTKHLSLKIAPDQPGSLSLGLQAIRRSLPFFGVTEAMVEVNNPSGFSRKNSLSALGLTQILKSIQNSFGFYPELVAGLPISGRDGTLKSRLSKMAQKVRAKTGYMTGIVSLAGYIDRGPGRVATFAFIFNGPASKADEAKSLMDTLCERIAEK